MFRESARFILPRLLTVCAAVRVPAAIPIGTIAAEHPIHAGSLAVLADFYPLDPASENGAAGN